MKKKEYVARLRQKVFKRLSAAKSLSWPDREEIAPLTEATTRCLRALIDHAGLTPESVAEKTGRPREEVEIAMDEPILMHDYFMLWELALGEYDDVHDKCAATIRILVDRDEMDLNAVHLCADLGNVHLFSVGALDEPDA